MAEWLRCALLAPQESGGPGSKPGADTEDQTVKLVAISSQWVTAGEYCEVHWLPGAVVTAFALSTELSSTGRC